MGDSNSNNSNNNSNSNSSNNKYSNAVNKYYSSSKRPDNISSEILQEKGLSFLELLAEPLIIHELNETITKITKLFTQEISADKITNEPERELAHMMNLVIHYLGLQVTKWGDDDVIYFSVPESYSKDYILSNGMYLAKMFKMFMLWCNRNNKAPKNFTFKIKIRKGETWDKLSFVVAKIAMKKCMDENVSEKEF